MVHIAVGRPAVEKPDHRHRWLLGARRERHSGDANQRNELPPIHSITASARASSVGGIVRPSAFAVFRLIASSNFVGRNTGSSAGDTPLRTLSINSASRGEMRAWVGPYPISAPSAAYSGHS